MIALSARASASFDLAGQQQAADLGDGAGGLGIDAVRAARRPRWSLH